MNVAKIASVAVACLCANLAVGATDERMERARALLESGDALAAYELLSAIDAPADDPEQDYLLGIAALDAGHPGMAVFAFERVLAAQPEHLYARAELGRALFRLGEIQDAMAAFQTVRSMQPPPEVLARVAEYETAIAPADRRGFSLGGYVEAFFGYDSNYTSATNADAVAIPAFGNVTFTLDDLFTENDSATGGLRGDVHLVARLSEQSTFFAGLGLEGAGYTESTDGYFYINLNGRIGVHHRIDDDDAVTVSLNGFNTWVGDLDYLLSIGTTASWRHQLSPRDSVDFFVRVASLAYDDVIDYRDVRQYLGGASYAYDDGRWSYGVGAFGGLEKERDDARRDVGRELYGARGFVSYAFDDQISVGAELTGQFSDYRGRDNLFQRTRDDELVRTVVNLTYRVTPVWSLRPEFRYTNNSSNIRTNDYERYEALVFVRREFD
ncbi:MAG: bacterial transcriptional activator domain-containing protein [Gammaproteobacteria bacterium]|nr:bacterial transcriptional activator domain-containing protein [Gammaproteobacteria bacterium]